MNDWEQRYHVPPWIFVTTHEGSAIVLDVRAGVYHGLDEMALVMWNLFAKKSTMQEVIHHIHATYETDGAGVRRDVEQFLQIMVEKQLLVPLSLSLSSYASSPKRGGTWRWFLAAICSRLSQTFPCFVLEWTEAFLMMTAVQRCLEQNGFERCIQVLEQCSAFTPISHRLRNEISMVSQSAPQVALPLLPVGFPQLPRGSKRESGKSLKTGSEPVREREHLVAQPVGISASDPLVERLARVVRSVARWQSFDAACLHQYVTLCFLFRRRGMQVDLVLGVSTHPFFPHAWLKGGPDALEHALLWEVGLGQDRRVERLQQLSVLFCTGASGATGGRLWEG